jgi:hypothetical protein
LARYLPLILNVAFSHKVKGVLCAFPIFRKLKQVSLSVK